MPDSALTATERQFRTLLDSAANGIEVHISLYSLPDVPRSEWGRHHVSRFYSDIGNLWDSDLDGLIVTGAEPQAPNLTEEPYWESLTKVLEWAEHNTRSAVCSCLAAHAAILHFDGIRRRRLRDKRFGVFECVRAAEDPLTAGVPSFLQVPHSRWNDIPGDELIDSGYRVLTRESNGGIDAFAKQRNSLFVCFQGHPEYEANTLLLEHRRDVASYLKREREAYPPMPQGYFDSTTADILTALQREALSNRRTDLLSDFPIVPSGNAIQNTWSAAATQMYRNWLAYLCGEEPVRDPAPTAVAITPCIDSLSG